MNWKTSKAFAGTAGHALAAVGFMLAGCSTSNGTTPAKAAGQKPTVTAQSGATLWAQNCGHCHNIRSPDSYSDAQWEVAALHMRVRANLKAEEHKLILAFLKSAH